MQLELSQKNKQIQQLQMQINQGQRSIDEAREGLTQARLQEERAQSKYKELEDFCIQQQEMIQILEIENLVAMAQIDGSKPMDLVETALADSMQWIRVDKNLQQYS